MESSDCSIFSTANNKQLCVKGQTEAFSCVTGFNWIYTNVQNLQGILANKINCLSHKFFSYDAKYNQQKQTIDRWDVAGTAVKVFKCYERVRCGSSGQTDLIPAWNQNHAFVFDAPCFPWDRRAFLHDLDVPEQNWLVQLTYADDTLIQAHFTSKDYFYHEINREIKSRIITMSSCHWDGTLKIRFIHLCI